jgi:hypothetical protein
MNPTIPRAREVTCVATAPTPRVETTIPCAREVTGSLPMDRPSRDPPTEHGPPSEQTVQRRGSGTAPARLAPTQNPFSRNRPSRKTHRAREKPSR